MLAESLIRQKSLRFRYVWTIVWEWEGMGRKKPFTIISTRPCTWVVGGTNQCYWSSCCRPSTTHWWWCTPADWCFHSSPLGQRQYASETPGPPSCTRLPGTHTTHSCMYTLIPQTGTRIYHNIVSHMPLPWILQNHCRSQNHSNN